jgi:hypothetical protein
MTLARSNGQQGIATEQGGQGIATEKSSVQMTVTWVVVAVVVVVVGVAVVGWLLRQRNRPDREPPVRVNPLSRLVVDALGAEWADRTGADVEAVRRAVLRGEPAVVRSHLAALIGDVEVGFEFNGAGPVRISVQCKYADGTSATTATMDVPWEEVPQEVRAQRLRSGDKALSRHWSIS